MTMISPVLSSNIACLLSLTFCLGMTYAQTAAKPVAPEAPPVPVGFRVIDVAPVNADHPVGFGLLTAGDQQFVAFYDVHRQATVGQRTLPGTTWKFKTLPTVTAWDSHNYLTLALDQAHCLHVSGNMHAAPLIYFRATKPWDIASLESVPHMTGADEDRVTYPKFQHDPAGRLIYSYRSGRSGQGNEIFNVYHEATQRWTRLFDQPLFDGEGQRNAYMTMLDPSPATDNYYHAIWVWRDTPDASTNHDLSYMRSRDLQHWETIAGKPLTLPVTLETPGVIVDAVPSQGGILNGGPQIGFGFRRELIISYYKFDAKGNTQLYCARFEQDTWKIYQGSAWDYRWEPKGGGSLAAEIHVGPVRLLKDKMTIAISHPKYGSSLWEIDPATMRLKAKLSHEYNPETVPAVYGKPQSTFPGLHVMWAGDSNPVSGQTEYRLRWEALGPHRDQPVNPPLPAPSMLQILEIPKE